MNPKKWGPKAWFFIHSVALNYPEYPTKSEKENYKIFFSSLENVLPCSVCAHNYKKHLKELPITDNVLASKKNLFLWTVKMHNKVNKLKGKSNLDPQYILDKYSKVYKTKIKL
jgi:FAD-linked sulfhydryl oxidase